MGQNFSTDLAREARDLWQKSAGEVPEGVTARREERQGFVFEAVEIRTADAAEKLGMPVGRYVTMELDALFRREEDAFTRAAEALAGELRRQLGLRAGESVTVVCLGNRDVTPDAVGPLTADSLLVTRHLRQTMPEVFGGFRPVSVLRTGVLGTTGVESAQLTAAVVGSIAPNRIVAVDALAARETGRLCRTVQITDAGIVPGSGVGNARQALTRDTLGIPVVSVGVPTVVDARMLCADLTGTEPAGLSPGELFVTPRDIDSRVRDVSRLTAYGVNLALHDGLSVGDIDMYLS